MPRPRKQIPTYRPDRPRKGARVVVGHQTVRFPGPYNSPESLAAVAMHATVIGIPFGVACHRIARFAACPFGKELVSAKRIGEKPILGTFAARVLWLLVFGWWIALIHLACAVVCLIPCLVVVPIFLGLPAWAVAHCKIASAALDPLGKRILSRDEAQAMRIADWSTRFAAKARS